jgi:hypothetical protein
MTPALNLARIALVLELVEYCRTSAQGLDDLLIAPFLAWLETRQTETATRALKRFRTQRVGRERLKGYRFDPANVPAPLPVTLAVAAQVEEEPGEPLYLPDDEEEEQYLDEGPGFGRDE